MPNKPDEVKVFLGSVLSGEGSESLRWKLSSARNQTAEATLSILKQGRTYQVDNTSLNTYTLKKNTLLTAEAPTRVIRRTILLFVQGC